MCVKSGKNIKRNKMDKIQEVENNSEKKEKVFNQVDPVLTAMDEIIPATWNRNQVASVFSVYLEIYR